MMDNVPFFTPYDGRTVYKLIRIIKTQNIKNFLVSLIGYLIASIIISRKSIFITYLNLDDNIFLDNTI